MIYPGAFNSELSFPFPFSFAPPLSHLLLFSPLFFPATTGPRHWELLQRSRATDNQFYICACSPARPSEGAKSYPSWGHSTIVNPWSEVVATIDEKEGIVNWKMERTLIEEVRKMIPIGRQRRWDVYRDVSRVWKERNERHWRNCILKTQPCTLVAGRRE